MCYKYQFGKLSDQGLRAPCGIPLKNADILLTYRSKSETLKSSALLRSEQARGLHVESVDGVLPRRARVSAEERVPAKKSGTSHARLSARHAPEMLRARRALRPARRAGLRRRRVARVVGFGFKKWVTLY